MRITILNQFYTPDISPTAHLAASLADGLVAEGHSVTSVCSRGGYVSKTGITGETSLNPRVYRIWTPLLGKATILRRCLDYAFFYLLAAWRMMILPRQDVIVSMTTPPYIVGVAILHRCLHPSTKVVLWNMDCYPDAVERAGIIRKNGVLSRMMRAMNRVLFARLDYLICLDSAMEELLVSQYAPRSHDLPVSIIPNWERAALFPDPRISPPSTQWAKSTELGLQNKFVILYLGNAGVGHPFETVIEAASQLRGSEVVFLFVGGGKKFRWLKDARDHLDLDNLILHGYVDKTLTPAVMSLASCALITLSADLQGVMSPSKLHSNLAMGLPIIYIGPPGSNVDDAITNYHCGVAIAPGDAASLITSIETLVQNPEKRAELSSNARAAFDLAYNDEEVIPHFLRLIESLFIPGRNIHPSTNKSMVQ
jgi:glycosyltransferase involved in cell wall biosynthesis